MKDYYSPIVRVRRNTKRIGGLYICERGYWRPDTLRGTRDRFRVTETIKVGTKAECEEAAK